MIEEKEYLKLKEDYERLKTAINELAILNEIATTISSTIELDKIIETIVKKCIQHFNVEQGNISLIKTSEIFKPLQTMVREYDSVAGRIPFRLDQHSVDFQQHLCFMPVFFYTKRNNGFRYVRQIAVKSFHFLFHIVF